MKQIRRVKGLDDDIRKSLELNGFNYCPDVIDRTDYQLMERLNLNKAEAKDLTLTISRSIVQSIRKMSALKLRDNIQQNTYTHLCSGLPDLDQQLRGGIPCGTVTEIVGPRSCGKSTMAFNLALRVFDRETDSEDGIVFIDTQRSFDAARVVEMSKSISNNFTEDHLQRISIFNIQSVQDLIGLLNDMEEVIVSKNIKLIIVDSINALRDDSEREDKETNPSNNAAGSHLLGQQAATLKKLAEDFSIPVIVTNTMTKRMDSGYSNNKQVGTEYQVPALGLLWSHSVNTRLILQDSTFGHSEQRKIKIDKSPICGVCYIPFEITPLGLFQISNEEMVG
ncbi:DNA repair protein RAD51 [Acrasis kona]|uniref:DNA repair protein RAD51 n=1 Tax=Acrasis kona TaxID=1008807 RepID=A0AAW2Z4M0_9EUKA